MTYADDTHLEPLSHILFIGSFLLFIAVELSMLSALQNLNSLVASSLALSLSRLTNKCFEDGFIPLLPCSTTLDFHSAIGKNPRMSNVVSIHPYFKPHEGKLDAFKELLPRFVEKTRSEKKCHWYDFSICGDTVHCREAYDGAEGLLTHIENVGAIIEEALTISELVRVEVHGPTAELAKLKEPLSGLNPDYFEFQTGVGKP